MQMLFSVCFSFHASCSGFWWRAHRLTHPSAAAVVLYTQIQHSSEKGSLAHLHPSPSSWKAESHSDGFGILHRTFCRWNVSIIHGMQSFYTSLSIISRINFIRGEKGINLCVTERLWGCLSVTTCKLFLHTYHPYLSPSPLFKQLFKHCKWK